MPTPLDNVMKSKVRLTDEEDVFRADKYRTLFWRTRASSRV